MNDRKKFKTSLIFLADDNSEEFQEFKESIDNGKMLNQMKADFVSNGEQGMDTLAITLEEVTE